MYYFVGIFFLAVISNYDKVNGLRCLACPRVYHILDCKITKQCGTHQECYASQKVDVNGVLFWDLGCRDTLRCTQPQAIGKRASGDTLICDQCCNSTLCQETLCGNKKPADRGPVCFACDSPSSDSCRLVKLCDTNYVCYVRGQTHFSSGCYSAEQCHALSHFLSLSTTGECINCCSGDLCNHGCSATTH